MKLKDLYRLVVDYGIEIDPRGRDEVRKELLKRDKDFKALPAGEEKDEFDRESLFNPYSDTRVLHGDPDTEINNVFVGIDIEPAELLLVNTLRLNKKIDLVMSHHPEGKALAALYKVMPMQSDILSALGVPVSVSESLTEERIKEVERRLSPVNHSRSADAARLLDIPFMCAHTPADNHVVSFLEKLMKDIKPETLGDVLKMLKDIPEYHDAVKNNSGPKIFSGDKGRKAGKVFIDMTGGTEGAKDIFDNLSCAGVDTLICMHLSEEHLKKASQAHLNVIVAGHIASDNIGLNILLDRICRKQKLAIICGSGFRRFERKGKS